MSNGKSENSSNHLRIILEEQSSNRFNFFGSTVTSVLVAVTH